MQVSFHHGLFFFCQPRNLNPMISKLFPPAMETTPRSRYIHRPSATTTFPPNHPESAATSLDDYHLLFSSQPIESIEPLPLLATEGALPVDFALGIYYLVGPGMIADGHGSTVNPLDDHGYLRAFHFIGGGAVMYSGRYVETETTREEREGEKGEWRFRRPGLFSMLKPCWAPPSLNLLKNVANTTVLSWGERLFCLWEGGHPYELEPTSLGTIGPADLIRMAEKQKRGGGGGEPNLAAGITKLLLRG